MTAPWIFCNKPCVLANITTLSPLQFAGEMAASLIEYARLGQPCAIVALIMAGFTGPVTMAGVLTLQNAEILARMAGFYGLSSRGGGCLTDAQFPDIQAGMLRADQRAAMVVRERLESYQKPDIDPQTERALRDYVDRQMNS